MTRWRAFRTRGVAAHTPRARASVRGIAGLLGLMSSLLLGVPEAEAETFTMSFEVRSSVEAACTLITTRLDIPIPRGSTVVGVGVTHFTIECPGASAVNQMPVRFTFEPSSGSGQFVLQEQAAPRQIPYDLCHDSNCATEYAVGVPGPVFTITSPSYLYALWGMGYPPPTGARPGNYRQNVDVTLTY